MALTDIPDYVEAVSPWLTLLSFLVSVWVAWKVRRIEGFHVRYRLLPVHSRRLKRLVGEAQRKLERKDFLGAEQALALVEPWLSAVEKISKRDVCRQIQVRRAAIGSFQTSATSDKLQPCTHAIQ